MIKIGLLGGENSHADCFAKYFNMPGEENRNDPEFRVTAVAGNYPEANKKLADYYGLDIVASAPEELIGKGDAVMVTARDGKYHKAFAEPFIKLGVPVFIDKPFTTVYSDACELIALAKKHGAPLCGGSSVRFSGDVEILANIVKTQGEKIHGGSVIAPLMMESEYSGFWFYASHLVEAGTAIFGEDIRSVYAVRNRNDVTAIIEYNNYNVTFHFMDGCTSCYQAIVIAKDRNYVREIDYSLSFAEECRHFVELIESGKMSQSYDSLIRPVWIMQCLVQSYRTGKKILL